MLYIIVLANPSGHQGGHLKVGEVAGLGKGEQLGAGTGAGVQGRPDGLSNHLEECCQFGPHHAWIEQLGYHLCVEDLADINADVEADRLVPQQKSKFSVLQPEIRETSLV